jgi:hypothetical protein
MVKKGSAGKKESFLCDNRNYLLVAVVVVLAVLAVGFFYSDSTGSGITRIVSESFVGIGEEFEVTLNIVLDDDQTYYVFEEHVPEGFVIVSPETNIDGQFRVAEIQDAKSNKFVYVLRAPEVAGTYDFSGEYGIEGDEAIKSISGDMQVVVA